MDTVQNFLELEKIIYKVYEMIFYFIPPELLKLLCVFSLTHSIDLEAS